MTTQINVKKIHISKILAVAPMTLLTVDTVNTFTFTSQRGYGLFNLADQQSGIFLGLPSIGLFFASIAFGFRQKARLTASLLIAGGALLGVSKIVEPILGLNLYLFITLPYLYISLVEIGFILMALGLWRVLRGERYW